MEGALFSVVAGLVAAPVIALPTSVGYGVASGGATALVSITTTGLITNNDAALLEKMTPTLQRTAGEGGFRTINPITGSEDFPEFTRSIPGLFYFLGVSPKGSDPKTQPANHSPLFFADEGALPTGVRAMANLAIDYLKSGGLTTIRGQ